jgi:mannose-6-phosphate isomerase
MSELLLSKKNTLECMFFPMTNVIQNYAWGSHSSFKQLFDIGNPSGKPQAEIWMGAHPNGCSTVISNGEKSKLSALIDQNRGLYLSEKVANQFGELPYLFKVLAAEKALSIQVHPSKSQAELGFALEDQQGIPFSAGNRNYKDANHKPELVYALTDYQAMNGFRPVKEIVTYFSKLDIAELSNLLCELAGNQTSQGLANFFSGLLFLQGKQKKIALLSLLTKAKRIKDPIFELIIELAEQYPEDVGLFAPLMLNVITLKPGQAMYLDAQTPHAYLKGTGLEIMANSDNVLRAGLTPKYIDVKELISCTRFDEKPVESLLLDPVEEDNVLAYPIPVDDFKFAIIQSSHQRKIDVESAEILLALDQTMLLTHEGGQSCVIKKGQSVFIPAYVKHYTVSSQGRVARAYS